MNRFRSALAGSAAALVLGAATMVTPASAQRANSCGQATEQAGGYTFTFTDANRSRSEANLIGLINAAIQNVDATVPVTLNDVAANVSVVCLTDTLNGNDVRILNGILNNVDVLDNSTFLNGLQVLSGANILAVDTSNNTIYVMPA